MDEYSLSKNQRRVNKSNKYKDVKKPSASDSLKGVYENTKKICHQMNLRPKMPVLYDIRTTEFVQKITPPEQDIPAIIEVKNMDTLVMAQEYVSAGLNPLVLNMASDYKPGGGVDNGKTAQEERLFQRSSAFLSHPQEWYPLEKGNVIYAPDVCIIKDVDNELLDKPFSVGMIAVAALRHPESKNDKYVHSDDKMLMYQKIESIFKIALEQGHDSLVLGALGCGVFENPPYAVAGLFKFALNIYANCFKRIGFAVLVTKPKDEINFKAFGTVVQSIKKSQHQQDYDDMFDHLEQSIEEAIN